MKQLVLLRGLPGSGKTTRAREFEAKGYRRIEADQYVAREAGVENWETGEYTQADLEKLDYKAVWTKAQTWMRDQTREWIETGDVVVAGVFISFRKIREYKNIARDAGAEFIAETLTGNFESIHQIDKETLESMAADYKPYNEHITEWKPITAHKSTNAIIAERVTKVNELLILGMRPGEIIRYISEKTDWNISPRQVENYMAKATEQIEASAKFNRDREIGRNLARMQALYQRNMSIQDFKAALATVKAINEMLGLDAPTVSTLNLKATPQTWKDFITQGDPDDDPDSGENSQ